MFASDLGIRVLIETLSPKRTSFLPYLSDVQGLIRRINRENVKLMADTCHIYDSEKNVVKTIERLGNEIIELHLRDSGDKPPGRGEIEFNEILKVIKEPLQCLEYKSTYLEKDLEEVLRYLGYRY